MKRTKVTKQDLEDVKTAIIVELRALRGLLEQAEGAGVEKRWIKSYEVQAMLGISRGTLMNMRARGEIVYYRMGGLIFYCYDDVVGVMERGRMG